MSNSLKDDLAAYQAFAAEISIVKHLEMDQRSGAWLQARCGRITASRIDDVMARKQPSAAQAKEAGFKLVREAVAAGLVGGPLEARDNYLIELVAERLTGVAVPHYVSEDMEKGTENEPLARAAYEFAQDCDVDLVGIAIHPEIPSFGASPDGLVGKDGLIELKCPRLTTHLKWMRAGVIPEEHVPQMMAQLACMPERKWNDFSSFCPLIPEPFEHLQLFTVRLWRDDAAIAAMEGEVVKFDAEVTDLVETLRGKR